MTMLSRQAIEEFQSLYRQKFGRELSLQDATEQATNLLRLYKSIFKTKNHQQPKSDKEQS